MKIIFLDIDGVLVNRQSLMDMSGKLAKGHPDCVAALNAITNATDARIVVSSTWRYDGLEAMQQYLHEWGVTGIPIDCTPILETKKNGIYIAVQRGDEIQAWLNENKVDGFVILDDDSDMKHLKSRLVQTEFERGLTMIEAGAAIAMLNDTNEPERMAA